MAVDRTKVLQSAQLLAAKGQYDAAIAEWRKLAGEAPNDGSIHNSIGDLHLKRNAVPEAITAFLQAAAGFRSEGATLKAIATYKKVLKVDPTRYEVYRHLGDLNAERGLLSSAVQDYLTLGKYYLKERKGKEALEVYKKIVSQDPSNLDAQQRVAELCLQENLQDEATKVYLQLGRERSAQGRYDEAKDAYLAVLRIDPKNNEAAQFVEGAQKGGAAAGKPAASGGPASMASRPSEPLDLLAEATRRMDEQQYAGAEAILNQLLTREPGNPQVCQLLARLHLQRGDVQVALGEYRFLAGAALRAQDYPLAEALVSEFLAAEPNSVPLIELSAELFEQKGDSAAAAQQYAKAVELLLLHPEPGMESLHEELFEKVKVLAPDSDLVTRLTVLMGGEIPADPAGVVDSVVQSVAEMVIPDPAPVSYQPAAEASDFSLAGAVQDDPPIVAPLVESAAAWQVPVNEAVSDAAPVSRSASEKVAGDGPSASTILAADTEPSQPGAWLTNAPPEIPQTVEPIFIEPMAIPLDMAEAPSVVSAEPPPDYEAHFTLGIAYKNMGLYEDAMDEFHVSKSADSFYLDSCLMTALCLKDQRAYEPAIHGLEAVLSDPRCQGAKGQAIRYELGMLYEAESQWGKAVTTYQTIPSFHDVPQRLESLRGKAHVAQKEFRLAS
ncbi:MAG: tetratricopeptide repeat protein [Nitrospira sp. CG24D]|nr:MAG: tetratricopeptide repeat protein [Nitrospira sp. CG24D]